MLRIIGFIMHYTYCAFYKLKIKSNQFVLLKSISIIKKQSD